MGTKGRQIISGDINQIITQLNKAFADEWLAYYQYWIGAQVIEGPLRDSAIKELLEHANDELRHAQMLSDRIIQLGGTPLLSPQEWLSATNCGYHAPTKAYVREILKQNIAGEQCAIEEYHTMMKHLKDVDSTTYFMAEEILADEIEHEDDLEALLLDLDLLKAPCN